MKCMAKGWIKHDCRRSLPSHRCPHSPCRSCEALKPHRGERICFSLSHPSYCLAQLQDPNTAVRVRAIYKPRVYGDAGGWHRTPMEWVAYRLNLLLGLDYVPPVAYRCGRTERGLPARKGVLDSRVRC